MNLPDETPLGDAKAALRERLRDGDRCPCCQQRAQVYRRPINTASALFLIDAWRRFGLEPFHLPTHYPARGDTAKARYWGFLAKADGDGFWHVTEQGARFAAGHLAAPRYALVYDGRCLGFEAELVTIRDCLGSKFDLDALLAGQG